VPSSFPLLCCFNFGRDSSNSDSLHWTSEVGIEYFELGTSERLQMTFESLSRNSGCLFNFLISCQFSYETGIQEKNIQSRTRDQYLWCLRITRGPQVRTLKRWDHEIEIWIGLGYLHSLDHTAKSVAGQNALIDKTVRMTGSPLLAKLVGINTKASRRSMLTVVWVRCVW